MDMKLAIKLLFAKNPSSLYNIAQTTVYQTIDKDFEFFNDSRSILDQVSFVIKTKINFKL